MVSQYEPKEKIATPPEAARSDAKMILESIVAGAVDPYMGYRKLFALHCSNNAALEEIKPMFRIPNVDPDSVQRDR